MAGSREGYSRSSLNKRDIAEMATFRLVFVRPAVVILHEINITIIYYLLLFTIELYTKLINLQRRPVKITIA